MNPRVYKKDRLNKSHSIWIAGLLLLTACTPPNTTPPTLAITTPTNGSPVSGTVPVQVSTAEEDSVTRIDLYVRGKGSSVKGVPAGSAVASPYVISWNTTAQPNAAELELVAVGIGKGGNEAESPPVVVKTQNSNVPYGVYLSSGDLAGPYEVQVKQAASAGTGAQKYSEPV